MPGSGLRHCDRPETKKKYSVKYISTGYGFNPFREIALGARTHCRAFYFIKNASNFLISGKFCSLFSEIVVFSHIGGSGLLRVNRARFMDHIVFRNVVSMICASLFCPAL